MAWSAGIRCVLVHHLAERRDPCRQAKAIETRGDFFEGLAHKDRLQNSRRQNGRSCDIHLIRVYPNLKVTFDSNTYRQALDLGRAQRDASDHELRKINAAIKDGRIAGYLSETLATLEGVQNAHRGAYFAKVEPKVSRALKRLPDGTIKRGYLVEGDDNLHPGLHPVVARWIAVAGSLGFRFLRAPRIGGPRPRELLAKADSSQIKTLRSIGID
jgi:hypothetical protein